MTSNVETMAASPVRVGSGGKISLGRRQKLTDFCLTLPASMFVLIITILPILWLFGLSFVSDGRLSLANYTRFASSPAYATVFEHTFKLAFLVTAVTAIVGYPTAYLISRLKGVGATIVLAFVLLPFWTSVVVRAYAWMIILQRKGVVNETLMKLGLIDDPLRLLNNFTGVTIGMVHVMVPFMVLPLIASMRAIDKELIKASFSLGASSTRTFWQVFFPLSMPGFTAGVVLVFVQSLGYYITPQLLGGGRVQTVAMKIKSNIDVYYDWGASSSLAVVLVLATLLLFWIIGRIRRHANIRNEFDA